MIRKLTAASSSTRHSIFGGFTLVELMTALAVGSFLVIGATSVYLQGRRTFQDNESISRLHEDARFALSVLEPDVRMAGFFGRQARADLIRNVAGPLDPVPPRLAVASPNCGTNWAIDLTRPIAGSNNGYDWTCAPLTGTPRPGSDTLVVRRAAEDPVSGALDPARIYLHTTRSLSNAMFLGADGLPFTTVAGGSATHELVTHGYYVSTQSSLGNDVPSLRRWRLASGPALVDEEILPGVEDMQVEFGVDTDALGAPTHGSINRYIAADDPMLDPADPAFDPSAQVLSVRVWLLVRALNREQAFVDTGYAYSDRDWGGALAPTDVRRVLVSRTIYLRNVRNNNSE